MDIKTLVKEHFNLVDADATTEVEFASVKTQDGGLELQYDGELAVGTAMVVADDEGNLLPAPDATYVLEDGTSLVVAEGKVAEIASPEELEDEDEETTDKEEMASDKEDEKEDMEDEEEEMEDEADKAEEEMEDEEKDMEARLESFLAELSNMLDEKVGKLEARVVEMEQKVDDKPASEPTIVSSNKKAETFSEVESRSANLKSFFSKQ